VKTAHAFYLDDVVWGPFAQAEIDMVSSISTGLEMGANTCGKVWAVMFYTKFLQ
jgi:hypothetical protein